jgi:hypothetical protein
VVTMLSEHLLRGKVCGQCAVRTLAARAVVWSPCCQNTYQKTNVWSPCCRTLAQTASVWSTCCENTCSNGKCVVTMLSEHLLRGWVCGHHSVRTLTKKQMYGHHAAEHLLKRQVCGQHAVRTLTQTASVWSPCCQNTC